MTLVWALDLPDSEKIVLLALADCANDEGHCWPGMRSLVRKCSKTDRTIQGAIQALCDRGHLTRREVPGKGCNYTVHPNSTSINPGETHYLYRTENPQTGEFYIGARSFFGRPAEDSYMGSGEWVKQQVAEGARLTRSVIGEYPSRDALGVAEQAATAAVFGQPLCRNRKIATPEALSPRNRLAPKGVTQTPEAASDKPSRTTKPKAEALVSALQEAWNAECKTSGLHECRVMNNSRKQMARLRIKEHGFEMMQKAIKLAHASPLFRGKTGDGRKADITIILQPKTIARLLDGAYGDGPREVTKITDPSIIALNKRATADLYDKMGRCNEAADLRREAQQLERRVA